MVQAEIYFFLIALTMDQLPNYKSTIMTSFHHIVPGLFLDINIEGAEETDLK